jgi:hypothetical protein
MPNLGSMLSKSIKAQMKQAVHVPYCVHTPKYNQRCEHHCRPSDQWITHQQKSATATSVKEDSVDRLFDLLFTPKEV